MVGKYDILYSIEINCWTVNVYVWWNLISDITNGNNAMWRELLQDYGKLKVFCVCHVYTSFSY